MSPVLLSQSHALDLTAYAQAATAAVTLGLLVAAVLAGRRLGEELQLTREGLRVNPSSPRGRVAPIGIPTAPAGDELAAA